MVGPVGNNLRLNRGQIAQIVGKSPRAVKQFESLFRQNLGESPSYGWRRIETPDDAVVLAGDYLLLVDATLAAIDIALPPAASAEGRELFAKLIDASGNGVTLTADGTETIDGAASLNFTGQWEGRAILSDGTQWLITAVV